MNLSSVVILSILICVTIIGTVLGYHQSALFFFRKKLENRKASQFVNVLERLGYFKYYEDTARVKSGIKVFHNPENKIEMLWHEDIIKNDIRFYRIETEFEIEYLINLLSPLFKKINLDISTENFEFQNDELDYDIFEFVKNTNLELEKRNVDEKIYLFDSIEFQIAVLTRELYLYIVKNSKNKNTKPLNEIEWQLSNKRNSK